MPPVAIQIQPRPVDLTVDPRPQDEPFDPDTFTPELIPDLDALAESAKCSCNAGDDNPY
jgi:hypothetical protein